MQILSVSLRNFKSHGDRIFHFQPGINAICGENGAGKTSILEAIAWAIFDYSNYEKKEDLIKKGAKSAQVNITFIAKKDGRTYQLERCTNKGYRLYDLQLKHNLEPKRLEDVTLWVKDYLGIPIHVNLSKLFKNTIGIPQGTFTADFLKSGEPRKQVFDPILNVEEYKEAYTKTAKLEAYARAQVQEVERAIAIDDAKLQHWDTLQQQQQALTQEIAQDEGQLAQFQQTLDALQQEKIELTAQTQKIQTLTVQINQLTSQIAGKQQSLQLLQEPLERATNAVKICTTLRESYQAFVQAETTLQELDQQTQQQQSLAQKIQKLHREISDRKTTVNTILARLETLDQIQAQLESLQPFLQQQQALEAQQTAIAQQLQQVFQWRFEQKNLEKQLQKLQLEQVHRQKQITELKSLEELIATIPQLEKERDRLTTQLNHLEAAKQFEGELNQLIDQGSERQQAYRQTAQLTLSELQNLQKVAPNSAAIANLAATTIQSGIELNQDLLTEVQVILADLSEQTSAEQLHQNLQAVKQQLKIAYQKRLEFATLDSLQTQHEATLQEISQLKDHIELLQQKLASEPELQQQQQAIAHNLQALGNPRDRSQFLQQELRQRPQLEAQRTQAEMTLAQIQAQIHDLETQLESFADLPERIEAQKQIKQFHNEPYLLYFEHRQDANQFKKLDQETKSLQADLEVLTQQHSELTLERDRDLTHYDPDRLAIVETAYAQAKTQHDQLVGSLPQKRKFLAQINQQITELEGVAQERDRAQATLKQKQSVLQFILDTRQVYNQAGPRITRYYLDEVSREADKLFREILNRQTVALEWTGDYEIRVQEGGYWRSFKNLSGGEQMCAALAVRLALLKVLADVDFAFFDEPTTNMDFFRRRQLADAIANLKTFQQLFIISHDDTFEQVTENVIRVEREAS